MSVGKLILLTDTNTHTHTHFCSYIPCKPCCLERDQDKMENGTMVIVQGTNNTIDTWFEKLDSHIPMVFIMTAIYIQLGFPSRTMDHG